MKKYYAVECDPESYDYRMYYDEFMAAYDNIWVGGNSYFWTTNKELREDVVKALEKAYYDIYEADNVTEDYIKDSLKYYFKKVDKTALTELEQDKLSNLVRMFNSCSYRDENDIICQVLTILHGETFENSVIRGCSQGDWLEIIYPESKKRLVSYIEAVYFATGTEFRITAEPVEEEDLEDTEVYHDYIELWKDEDIRDWLCKNIGCKSEELVIRRISGQHTHITYDYKEV